MARGDGNPALGGERMPDTGRGWPDALTYRARFSIAARNLPRVTDRRLLA